MTELLKGKKALVTGASQGIGLAIAEAFLSHGADVAIVARNEINLSKAREALVQSFPGAAITSMACDCADTQSLQNLANHISQTWSELDIVVANVGDGRSVADAIPDQAQWENVWATNFDTALYTARIFLPFLERSQGNILFISSITGLEALGAPTDYSTAKAALIAMAKNLSKKVAPAVRVNVLAPGNVMAKGGAWEERLNEDRAAVENFINTAVPLQRFAKPAEIADAAVFLCSAKASFITGATLVVDGGQTTAIS